MEATEVKDIQDPAELEKLAIASDGAIVDLETGEIHGYQNAPEISDKDLEKAIDWYLGKRAFALADKAGLEKAKAELIAGIEARYDVQIREQENRVKWLDSIYKPHCETCGRETLIGGKAESIEESNKRLALAKVKNVKRPFGTLAFSSSRESLSVLDTYLAAAVLLEKELYAPLRITIDLAELEPAKRPNVLFALFKGSSYKFPKGVSAEILVSKIPADSRKDLPEDSFTLKPAGAEFGFKIEHN
jgi:hypothetical protein